MSDPIGGSLVTEIQKLESKIKALEDKLVDLIDINKSYGTGGVPLKEYIQNLEASLKKSLELGDRMAKFSWLAFGESYVPVTEAINAWQTFRKDAGT